MIQPLIPFADAPHLRSISLTGEASWCDGELRLTYCLQLESNQLILPLDAPAPRRRDGLWEHTCFEAFVSQPGHQGYWEINLSPNGDWNCYRLVGYRENLQAEDAIQQLPIVVDRTASSLQLFCTVPLGSLIDADSPLEISLTAVLEHQGQGCSYWAWKHSGPQADFHLRDSFTILMPDYPSLSQETKNG
ncbi:hypothetical protein ACHAW6_015100 [Cyclotella cf. meneghiniana]